MGANDYLDEMQQDPEVLTNSVVSEIVTNIQMLINAGGEHFLVMDIPDLSKTVRGRNSPEIAPRFAILSQLHHKKMASAIALLQTQNPTVNFYFINVYDLFNDMLTSPEAYNKKYQVNIQNTTESCWLGGFMLKKDRMTLQNNATHKLLHSALTSSSISEVYRVTQLQGVNACDKPDQYVFWDEIHPTRVVHGIFASIIEEKLAPHLV